VSLIGGPSTFRSSTTFDLSTSLVRKGCVGEGGIAVTRAGVHEHHRSPGRGQADRHIIMRDAGQAHASPATKIVSRTGGTRTEGPARTPRPRTWPGRGPAGSSPGELLRDRVAYDSKVFRPVWHAEYGVDELHRLAQHYQRARPT
jgi:hypothetical protein